MASPDLPGYIDLTVVDEGPLELVERAAVNLPIVLPGFVWRAGSPEAVLTESLALIGAQIGYQINRTPAAIFETLMGRYGVAYDQGNPPTTTITITMADTAGYVLPAGTRFRLDLAGGQVVVFTLDANAVIAPGALSPAAPVAATGTANTDAANGTLVGTPLALMDAFAAFETATLATAPIAGRSPEASEAWFDRGAARLQRLTEVLTTADQFEAAAVELEPAVVRVKGFDRYDPSSGNTPAAKLDLGHMTLAVGGAAGAPLTSPQKVALEAALEELARVELDAHLIDPTITDLEVHYVVERLATYSGAEVDLNVRAAILAYVNASSWPWSATVYRLELVSIIDQAEGVARVVDVTIGTANRLTANQASLETNTTGWAVAQNCTLTRSLAAHLDGVAALAMSSVAAGDMRASTHEAAANPPASPGVTYTLLAWFRAATVARNCLVRLEWKDAGGVSIGASVDGVAVADTLTGWTLCTVTAVAPVGTASARCIVQTNATGGALEVHYVDAILFGRGALTRWSPGSGNALAAADLAITGAAPLAHLVDAGITGIVNDPA